MLLQQMLDAGRLPDFIDGLWEAKNEDMIWEFYLHKVEENISFDEFMEGVKPPTLEPVAASSDSLKETVRFSFEMLENFHPDNANNR